MNDIKQIRLIIGSLQKDKERYLRELSAFNSAIFNKESMIAKMQDYQNDYLNNYNLKLSKSIPGLHQNITMFVKKIALVISQAEQEVCAIDNMKKQTLTRLQDIDKKIELMKVFEEKQLITLKKEEDKQEQAALDDLASNMDKREEYE